MKTSSKKKWKKKTQIFRDASKSVLTTFLRFPWYFHFYQSYDSIFFFYRRIPWCSEECFKYLQSVLNMIFHNSGVVWNESIKGNVKKSSKPILENLERSEFFPFFEEIFISYDFRIVKIIFSTFWRYLKHSLNIKECVGIKISCTTRINENIKANVEKSLL